MKIYTSYFGNWRNFPKDAKVLGITRFPAAGLRFPNEKLLAPSEDLLLKFKNGELDEKLFAVYYIEELRQRGFKNTKELVEALKQASDGDDLVLCCYEKKGEFCHRHILAQVLKRYVEVEEL